MLDFKGLYSSRWCTAATLLTISCAFACAAILCFDLDLSAHRPSGVPPEFDSKTASSQTTSSAARNHEDPARIDRRNATPGAIILRSDGALKATRTYSVEACPIAATDSRAEIKQALWTPGAGADHLELNGLALDLTWAISIRDRKSNLAVSWIEKGPRTGDQNVTISLLRQAIRCNGIFLEQDESPWSLGRASCTVLADSGELLEHNFSLHTDKEGAIELRGLARWTEVLILGGVRLMIRPKLGPTTEAIEIAIGPAESIEELDFGTQKIPGSAPIVLSGTVTIEGSPCKGAEVWLQVPHGPTWTHCRDARSGNWIRTTTDGEGNFSLRGETGSHARYRPWVEKAGCIFREEDSPIVGGGTRNLALRVTIGKYVRVALMVDDRRILDGISVYCHSNSTDKKPLGCWRPDAGGYCICGPLTIDYADLDVRYGSSEVEVIYLPSVRTAQLDQLSEVQVDLRSKYKLVAVTVRYESGRPASGARISSTRNGATLASVTELSLLPAELGADGFFGFFGDEEDVAIYTDSPALHLSGFPALILVGETPFEVTIAAPGREPVVRSLSRSEEEFRLENPFARIGVELTVEGGLPRDMEIRGGVSWSGEGGVWPPRVRFNDSAKKVFGLGGRGEGQLKFALVKQQSSPRRVLGALIQFSADSPFFVETRGQEFSRSITITREQIDDAVARIEKSK